MSAIERMLNRLEEKIVVRPEEVTQGMGTLFQREENPGMYESLILSLREGPLKHLSHLQTVATAFFQNGGGSCDYQKELIDTSPARYESSSPLEAIKSCHMSLMLNQPTLIFHIFSPVLSWKSK